MKHAAKPTRNDLSLAQAVAHLKAGGVLAYPTEAVWGLGCDPYNQDAVDHVLALKERSTDKGVILVAGSVEQVESWLTGLTPQQRQKVIDSWPSATTWLVPRTPDMPIWITGKHQKIAIRVTAHPSTRDLCLAFGGVLVSTSANPAGLDPAKSATEVYEYFGDQVPCLMGTLGNATRPSQIIDAVTGEYIRR